jgi:hypothetical protein
MYAPTKFPDKSDENYQVIIPPSHPNSFFALAAHVPKSPAFTNPVLDASP